jgi:hypothetical protein
MTPNFPKDGDYVNMSVDKFDEFDDGYIPVEVYHYTGLQTAIKKILKDRCLLLSEITKTNDPRESKTRLYNDVNWGTYLNNNTSTSLGIEDKEITGEWRVLCISCAYYPPCNFIEEYKEAQQDGRSGDHHRYGIGYSTMWAHYGEKHSGVCLIFDGQELAGNIEDRFNKEKGYTIHHGFVRYDYELSIRDLPAGDMEINDSQKDDRQRHYLNKYFKEYFLYKSKEWQVEHEFRWLVHSKDRAEEMKVSIENTIKAVVIGVDVSDIDEQSIQMLCKNLGIQMYKMRWFHGRPRADLVSK